MIKDQLARHRRFHGLGCRIAAALTHAAEGSLALLPDGRFAISEGVTVQIQHYMTKPDEHVRWEGHRANIDLQVVMAGREMVGVAPIEQLVAEPYDEERDLLWLNGEGDRLTLTEGAFLLLWPEDGHRPGIDIEAAAQVRKAVYKIAV